MNRILVNILEGKGWPHVGSGRELRNVLYGPGWYPTRSGRWNNLYLGQSAKNNSLDVGPFTVTRYWMWKWDNTRAQQPESAWIRLKILDSEQWKMWVTRGEWWATTMTRKVCRRHLMKDPNISPHTFILHDDTKIGTWLTRDQVPIAQGFFSVGS